MPSHRYHASISALAIWNGCLFAACVAIAVGSCHAHATEPQAVFATMIPNDQLVAVAESHAAKHHEPCFILIGASWCVPCHIVERDCVPVLQQHGTYVHLDIDRHREPVRRLIGAAAFQTLSLPTLIVIDAAKGTRRVIVGPSQIRAYVETRQK